MPKQANRVSRRKGKGLLPPNPKQWDFEHNGLDVRQELGVPLDAAVDERAAFSLLSNVTIVAHGELEMAQTYIERFRGGRSGRWSGMCVPLPDGETFVIYNDSHAITRIRATLMEEFFHLRLGHPPTSVRIFKKEGTHRSYQSDVEREAYESGAALLVPYKSLREMLLARESTASIATQFGVSPELVRFRAKVTRLYSHIRKAA